MPIIKVISGTYCRGQEVIDRVAARLGYRVIPDRDVVREAAQRFNEPEAKLMRTLEGKVSAFDNFTRERQRNVSRLKLTLADLVRQENIIIAGAVGHLVPRTISHALSVCLIAEMVFRVELAAKEKGIGKREAQKLITKDDEAPKLLAEYLFKKSPWDASLYDVLVPLSKTPVEDAVELICAQATSDALKPTPDSLQAVEDFRLAAQVEAALGKEGHEVMVGAENGVVTLTINKHTLMLSRLEDELKKVALKVPEVKEVKTKVGPGFYQSDIYRRFDFEVPSRVLLVDDEKEFVQTLSERLSMRDMGTAVVYDGEQALSFVEEEVPDVIVLDLKMPGIDGIEVLRRLKQDHPDVEVIILTGHGTDKDRELCLDLGAFAYLQKPVDIEKLSLTMQEAYKKLRERKKSQ